LAVASFVPSTHRDSRGGVLELNLTRLPAKAIAARFEFDLRAVQLRRAAQSATLRQGARVAELRRRQEFRTSTGLDEVGPILRRGRFEFAYPSIGNKTQQ